MERFTCTLPGGYLDATGELHREAELMPLGGREEELLARPGPAAGRVTEVLCRCVRRLGGVEPLTRPVARELLAGDRQYLLLELRRLTFGDRVRGTASCPWPGCGEEVEVDFSLDDVPVQGVKEPGPTFSVLLSEAAAGDAWEDGGREVRFRLPNGGDEESLEPLLPGNEAEALTALLERCVISVGPGAQAGREGVAALSPLARWEIEAAMEARAPRLGLEMATRCPACERRFTLPFELRDFFFGELRTSLDLLYREVHYLAFHYHWSEGEILDLPRDKRRAYIEVLADEIEKLEHAAS